jgi:hypothetical protein
MTQTLFCKNTPGWFPTNPMVAYPLRSSSQLLRVCLATSSGTSRPCSHCAAPPRCAATPRCVAPPSLLQVNPRSVPLPPHPGPFPSDMVDEASTFFLHGGRRRDRGWWWGQSVTFRHDCRFNSRKTTRLLSMRPTTYVARIRPQTGVSGVEYDRIRGYGTGYVS